MRNLITDVPGVLVGNAQDMRAATGATVAIFDQGAVASIATLGGAPGDRMGTSLEPEMVGQAIDAVVLSGGSVYGLDAAGGASAVLCQRGQGRTFGGLAIPVAVQAILFDLINGGEKDWMREPVKHEPPYWALGRDAALVAAQEFALGTAGAGVGATTAGLKGGLGSTSARTSQGFTVGALVAVNAVGSAMIGNGPHFWAGAYEQGNEFGGLGWPARLPEDALKLRFKGQALPATATTIALVATDAALTKAECKRLAIMANDGLSKSLRPVHAPNDGDTVFAAATGRAGPGGDPRVLMELGTVAADCLARAVARGVYEATALPFPNAVPDWKTKFGGGRQ
ncbi:MAG: peptidase S58 family protein [Reyranella sp.]|uniref:P1 family peptidase n=1 Tax=Reyranella sp. TaxID=1929291 RepID=UPI001224644E|nr:P1 family peptidase [Reyranella sp.]TAJ91286.1 MAG: peptidase S58 family protein [Reyranella sp.]